MRAHPRRRAALLGALLAGVVALGGCSGTDSAAPGSGGGEPGFTQQDPSQRGEAAAPEAPAGAPGAAPDAPVTGEGQQQAPAPVEERSLIYTGSISVKVDDVARRADQARDIATGLGGTVGGDRRTLDGDRSEAQVILRVPAERFETALEELAKLGVEETRAVQTEDVTEALVDLDARLATQRASVERVRALLAQANTIGEIVSIESELTRREAELASLEQRKERLAGLVALSTITANLRGPGAAPPEEPESGFVAGLKNGWKAFLESVEVLLTVAGYLLPWLVAIAVPVWLLIWFARRRRPALPSAPSAGPPSAPPASPPPTQ